MSEVALAALEPRLQKLVESARLAFAQGRYPQAVETAAFVLQEQPSCLPVRQLLRTAQLKLSADKGGRFGQLLSNVSSAPFVLGGSWKLRDQPRQAVASADKILRRDPHDAAGLVLLGQAALALAWNGTAVFAFEAARENDPDRPELVLLLGQALLAAGRSADAVQAAQEALRRLPTNADAQALLRNASIAATVTKGKWEAGGDYRAKLHDEQQAAQLEQTARLKPDEGPPPSH